MLDILKSNMPIISRHGGWEINLPNVLAQQTQSDEISIQMATSTETTPKSLGKLASRSATHFKPLNISRPSQPPTTRPSPSLSLHGRMDIL